MSNLVSFIVPVYNVENYLVDCLESIVRQTYENIEIVLVNDGSTDRSPAICREYAAMDKRIKLINKQNGGLSDARNIGIDNARGQWITFVDSDDVITEDYCSSLVNTINESSSDIAIGGVKKAYIEKNDTGKWRLQETDNSYDWVSHSDEEIMVQYYYRKIPGYVCGVLIKKSIIGDLRFPKGRLFEDAYFMPRLLQRSKKVSCLDKIIYYYRQRYGSIVNSQFSRKSFDQYYMVEDGPFDLSNLNNSLKKAVYSKMFISGLDTLRKVTSKEEVYPNEIKEIKDKIRRITPVVLRDSENSTLVRLLAFIYGCNPNLAINVCKIRKYMNIQRI
ncbi:glycosyltransferase family 2 protein [Faecalibaculum rodentium]|uniref:glycosyltransferase family 2 protein n=1 Tax=Faecalibaculum rodentium TaxID=1702221 RepID=UPI0023F56914|nr:glycosyltransferase family 2 protein [Faecalibaculum rodentium]